jgi:hypothetical protein
MQQFIYFLTNPGNESFLKKEIKHKYPGKLNFSYSRPGLCTYKNIDRKLSLDDISKLNPIYARCWGESLGIVNSKDVITTINEFIESQKSTWNIQEITRDPEEKFEDSFNFACSDTDSENLLIIIKVDEGQYFIGKQLIDKFDSPPGRYFYDITVTDAPSRAYHKVKEAFLLLNMGAKRLTCVEFGCAPGGSTKYLLENNHIVCGVDPAEIDKEILNHKNFEFIQKPIQGITRKDLPKVIDILISDVNLNPDVVLKQCHGIFKSSPAPLALITLKPPKPKYLDSLKVWIKFLKSMGYKNIDFVQISSHRKECLAIARI